MKIATHNVKVDLDDTRAGNSVAAVLRYQPDIIGLQEWGRSRRGILKNLGRVVTFPKIRYHVGPPHKQTGYVFAYPLGGQPVGVRADVIEVVSVRRIKLSSKRPGVRATFGTELVCQIRGSNETVPLLNVHPAAHHDRPENKAAWLEAVQSIEEWAEGWAGFRRYVVGDMNKQGLRIAGLVSCWAGRESEGTFRTRTIDEVYATRRADSVHVIHTPSDHDAVIAAYEEKP